MERFVIGEPGSLPSSNTMPSAFHSIQLAAHTCCAQLVAKSFRLSKGHDIIVGTVNQQKRRRRCADIVDRREPSLKTSSIRVPFTASRTLSGIMLDMRDQAC